MYYTKLNILVLADTTKDAKLVLSELDKSGFDYESIHVDNLAEYKEQLFDFLPHIILSDYELSECNAIEAFDLLGEIDIPFIIVSGTVGEKKAVEALRMGVTDMVSKDSMSRLPLVIERALNEKKVNREKRSAEHELILNKERLELALEGTDLGVWDLDFMSNTIVYNMKSLAILGLTDQDAILDFKYFQEQSRSYDEQVEKAMADMIEGRSSMIDYEVPILRQDEDKKRWVLARGKVTRTSIDGKPIRASGTLIDVTERKNYEESLKKNQAILENAEGVAHMGSFEWNLINPSFVCSEEFRNVFGLNQDEEITVNRLYRHSLHPQDRSYFREVFQGKKDFYDIEHRIILSDESTKIVRNSGHIRTDTKGNITLIMGVVQDITEQREVSKSIFKAQQDERARMARDIHDGIGQMLVAAKFKLSSLDLDLIDSAEAAKDDIEDLLATILEEVRRVSRNLSNRNLEDFGLSKTLEYFIDEIVGIAPFNLSYNIDLPEEYDLELSNAIYRVTQEAVNNVIKYAKAKNVTVKVETTKENIILEVQDDGIGFDTEIKWNGIKNMKERTSLQNGHFEIDSVPNQGTVVKSWFPLNNS